MRTGPPRLPVELTDRIIDFCHNDKRTLSNCALTHSSWLAASRFHLFHAITTTGVYQRTERAVQLKSILRRKLFAFLHERPSILPYIRIVKIELSPDSDGGLRLENAVHLAHTIRRFCSGERLPVPAVHVNLSQSSQFAFIPDLGHALRPFSPVSDIVTQVRLSGVTFSHPNDIWPFLSSFPRLRFLELESVGFKNSRESSFPAEGIFDGVPLSAIRMATASMGFVIRSLIKVAGSLSHLEEFGIAYQDIRQRELPQLADAIQRRVKFLRFSASCYPDDERGRGWRPSTFDIRIPEFVGRFRSLQTLVLDNLRVDDPAHSGVSFEWITEVLQQLASPVQKLVFEVTITDYSQLNAIPWAFIDRIVSPEAPQFRALVRVQVLVKRGVCPKHCPCSIGRDVVCSEITQRLPALSLLGLLWCDTVGC